MIHNNRHIGWTNNMPSIVPYITSLSGYISIYQYQSIITIFGNNFRSFSIVRFGTFSLPIVFLNSNQISFYVPSSTPAGSYTVQVFNDSVGSNYVNFDITSISGPTGAPGPIGPTGAPGGVTGPQGATGATELYWGFTGGNNTALYNTNPGGELLLNSSISLYGGTKNIYTNMSYNRLGYSYTSLFGNTGVVVPSDNSGYTNAGQLIISEYGVYMITCQCNIICNDQNATITKIDIVISKNKDDGVPLTPYGFRYYSTSSINVTDPLICSTTLSGVFTVNYGLEDNDNGFPIYVNATSRGSSVYLNGGISATRIA